jgi:hypothetical protein
MQNSLRILSKALFASKKMQYRGFLAEKRENWMHSVRRSAASSWLLPVP